MRRKKHFFTTMDKKYVFVTKYFLPALKLFTVVFKRSGRSISSDDTKRVDLFVICAYSSSILPLQFFVEFKLKTN